MVEATLVWSGAEPPIPVASPQELFALLERAGLNPGREPARAVTLRAHHSELTLGVGPAGCFVQIAPESGDPPYYVTLGDDSVGGATAFYLHGEHHTEIPRRCLLPWGVTKQVVREFYDSGRRSPQVDWCEV